ncbi:major capsid protein, partial [Salmonella enterica]|uniref:major capsid protein n=1 Tax=Salmonella enterica TaxID=28901 RepID=UPI002246DA7F
VQGPITLHGKTTMKNALNKACMAVRNNRVVAGLTLALVGAPAFAQTTSAIDVSGPVAQITAGLAAIATLGAAWVGFKYLKKVWNRI